jgi:O-succinylhomoserine sulfhydrylase
MDKKSFETLAIRSQAEKSLHREHSVPLYLTSSFTFDSALQGSEIFKGIQAGNLYSRFSNPNTSEFIQKLCLLEDYETGVSTSSGMAAVYTSMVSFLEAGDHIVASKNSFGNTLYIIQNILTKMGVSHTLVEVDDNSAWEQSVQPNTKMFYLETPSNPTLKIADLSFISDLCNTNKIISIVDNCFASPYLQNPSKFGIDLCVHSATKYIDGQGRVLGGAILGSQDLISKCYEFLRRTGAALSPFNAWILSKSLETLAVRMERHCENALMIATFLNESKAVENTIYPFLPSMPQYALAKKQMKLGGGIVAFNLKGDANAAFKFLDSLKIHSLTANLGDSRSIATHPSSTTHSKLTQEEQQAAGISTNFIRLSVGLENINDIIYDLDQAILKTKSS